MHGNRSLFLLVCLLIWSLGSGATTARGQSTDPTDPLSAIGVPSFSAMLPVENGSINAANGNLHLEFPLGVFPQRSGPPVRVALTYDSTIWDQLHCCTWTYGMFSSQAERVKFGSNYIYLHGWKFTTSVDDGELDFNFIPSLSHCNKDGQRDYDTLVTWTWTAPDGTLHAFPIKTVEGIGNSCGINSQYNVPTGDALALDASGYHMYVTNFTNAVVFAPDGTQVYTYRFNGTQNPKDTNGNYFLQDSQNNVIDTLGRTIVETTSSGNTITFNVLNAQGGRSTYTATVQAINVHTNFGFGSSDLSGQINVISAINLPDGTSYSFGYDSGTTAGYYGQLTSMKLPTGSQITYSYTNFLDPEYEQGLQHITRGVHTRITPDGQWTYTPAVITSCTASLQTTCKQSLTVTKPSGDNAVYMVDLRSGVLPVELDFYSGAVSPSNLLATLTQSFDTSHPCAYANSPYNLCSSWQSMFVTKTGGTTTLPIPGGTINKTIKNTWDPTHFGNITNIAEYNFYVGSLPSSPTRNTAIHYKNDSSYVFKNITNRPDTVTVTNSSGGTVRKTLNSYDSSALVSGVGSCPAVAGSANHDDTNYGTGNNIRGNLTTVQRLVSGTSNYISTSRVYDITGQVRTATDANNNQTSFCYADKFYNDNGNGTSLAAYTPPAATNAYPTTVNSPVAAIVTNYGYYWGSGKQAFVKDANGQTTYSHFFDPLDRHTSTLMPDGGWTYLVYPSGSETQVDTATGITSTALTTNCPASSNACEHDQTLFDSMGRISSKILVSDPDGQTTVATAYDSNGRVRKVSNPYRSTSDVTYGWTTNIYDGLDRTVQLQRQDGGVSKKFYGAQVSTGGGETSQLCSSSVYGLGYPVLTADEAGNKLQAWLDGFGRLIEVDEPDSTNALTVPTCYQYDLLDNLSGVVQNSSRNRSFVYDLLSRLTSASNPESGGTTYTYDSDTNCASPNSFRGLLVSQTDARGVRTCMQYDALNRLTQKSYSDGTVPALFGYDATSILLGTDQFNIANSIGRLSWSWSGLTTANARVVMKAYSYDAVGRVAFMKESTPLSTSSSPDYQLTFSYDIAGNVLSLTYPSGRVVRQQYAGANRVKQVTFDNFLGTSVGYNYLSGATYAPEGAPASMTLGNGFTETSDYNSRLQPKNQKVASSALTALYRSYSFYDTAAHNNGNVMSIADNLEPNRTQAFTYDQLNRISSAHSAATLGPDCWAQSFGYDAWGNLLAETPTQSGCSMTTLNVGVNANNQITNSGFSYDTAGNLLTDGVSGNHYAYDAESRINSLNSGAATYYYDADGQRTLKTVGSDTTEYLYFGGQPLAERKGNGSWTDYIYAGGRRLARSDNYENRIHISGTTCSGSTCGAQYAFINVGAPALTSHVLRSGDKLYFTQYQAASRAGIVLPLTDGTYATGTDQNGNNMGDDPNQNQWDTRIVDLSAYAGKTIQDLWLTPNSLTPAGNWNLYFESIALVSSDGTVIPVYAPGTAASLSISFQGSGITNLSAITEQVNSTTSSNTTTYYHADHLGSARLISTSQGFPISSATYLPFGQEWNPQPTANHYKFTGKERDAESGLDNFGARYNSSSMGRFMSPDLSLKSAINSDPQTWNRYAYTRNNPLKFVDIGGKCTAPAGVGQGQVGVCIEAYIAAPRIGGIGFGDKRGPVGNDPKATFKYQFQAVIDTRTSGNPIVSEHDAAGTSQVGVRVGPVSVPIVGRQGTESTDVSKPTQDNNGNIHFAVNATANNGFAGFPLAPSGAIMLSIPLVITPQGVGVDPGGARSAYPSLEVYSYDSTGKATPVLQIQETKPGDLGVLNQNIPAVPPPPPPPPCPRDDPNRPCA